MSMQRPVRHDIGLARKRAFLSDPGSYPEGTSTVAVVETHMALVFLTDASAYKLKKPVRYDYLDFRALGQRRRMCLEEVRLNRRLAPDVYRGVIALTDEGAGRLRLGGSGPVVDWLIAMRRLPADRMLDAAIAADSVSPTAIVAVAHLLAGFYRRARVDPVTPAAYRDRLARTLSRDVGELASDPACAGPARDAAAALRAFLERDAGLVAARAEAGRIVEGHGDLRPEHVCLTDPPVIIDCLEFEPAFRLVDPADELAFLALECELAGALSVGERCLAETCAKLDDCPAPILIDFYRGCRALLRARLAWLHLGDVPPAAEARWRERTRRYLAAAVRYGRATGAP